MFRMVLPRFSSRVFIILGFTFKSFIHLDLVFVYGLGKRSSFNLLHMASQLSQYHLLKKESSPHCLFLSGLSQIRWQQVCRLISGFPILFHWSVCLFYILVLCCFSYCSPVVQLEIGQCDASSFVLFAQDRLGSSSSFFFFWFHMNF